MIISRKETFRYFLLLFNEFFPLALSSGLLSIPPVFMENTRWPKLKPLKIRQALYQQAPYKAPGPDNIKTIATRKTWKVSSCQVITKVFREYIKIRHRPEDLPCRPDRDFEEI